MQFTTTGLLAALLGLALQLSASEAATPVEKVITLLEDLKAKVEGEGSEEKAAYEEFSAFCKTQTEAKSGSIAEGKDAIETVSADIESKTALKESKAAELREKQGQKEGMTKDLQSTVQQCEKDQAEYEATASDLSSAVRGLTGAVKAMEDSKPAAAPAAMLQRSYELAEALKVGAPEHREKLRSFLQQDPEADPVDATYQYHSHGILKTLTTLKDEFLKKKEDTDEEWAKTEKSCASTKKSLTEQIETTDEAIETLETEIITLKGEVATHRTELVNKEAVLKDDEEYLKDLKERCSERAADWEQRQSMRAGELEALEGAIDVMKNKVSGLDASANARALLQRAWSAPTTKSKEPKIGEKVDAPPMFVQEEQAAVRNVRSHGHLRATRAEAGASMQVRQGRAAALLRDEGLRLHSASLSMLSGRVEADPFAKVKTLIQKLIERLLAEATAEATKKSFCDTEMGKAQKDRDHRYEDAQRISVELEGLESKHDTLDEEVKILTEDLKELNTALVDATEDRKKEKEDNLKTLKDADEGLGAVNTAITILKVFYKKAAKAAVLVQVQSQDRRPTDADTKGPGFSGAYKGEQAASKGIIGMLEVIRTDFERTLRVTEAAEKKSQEGFVDFDRASRTDISGKETKLKFDEEDLASTKTTIQEKLEDLKTAMKLLDSAVKVMEELKPTCVDTHMSYEDRVAKREEEVAALKKAMCILDPEGAEPDCSS